MMSIWSNRVCTTRSTSSVVSPSAFTLPITGRLSSPVGVTVRVTSPSCAGSISYTRTVTTSPSRSRYASLGGAVVLSADSCSPSPGT